MRAINNPEIIEKRSIQGDVTTVGIALIGFLFLTNLTELIIFFIIGEYPNGFFSLAASLVGFGFIWFCFRSNFKFKRVLHERREIPGKVFRNALFCVIGIIPLFHLLERFVEGIFLRWNYVAVFPGVGGSNEFWPLVLLSVVLVNPFIEEVLFRGVILRKLSKYGRNFSILFSAALFGLYQPSFVHIGQTFALGVILGYITFRYSLKWALALHCIHNSVMAVAFLIKIPDLIYFGVLGVFFVLMGVVFITKRDKLIRFFRLGRSFENAYRYAVAVPWILVYVGMTIFASALQTDIKNIHDLAGSVR